MKILQSILIVPLLGVALAASLSAQGTAFTYQGRLTDDDTPASGIYDLRFAVYAVASGGSATAGPVTIPAIGVSNGLFTVTLDFGSAPFSNGAERWLELSARTNGSGPFATLSPRQRFTATPYALTAGSLTGVVPGAGLVGTYPGAVNFSSPANQFTGTHTGNGSGLTGLNAANLAAGIVPDARLSGNVALLNTDARFNGRVEAVGDLKGWRLNVGTNHLLSGEFSTVAGGAQNLNQGYSASIGGGQLNSIQTNANFATIAGGQLNIVQSNAFYATIGGGREHVIESGLNSQDNTIGGGRDHTIRRDTQYGTVSGGVQNTIQDNGDYGTTAGGGANIIHSNASFGSIGGGTANRIDPATRYATIAGGRNNVLGADYSFVVGSANIIQSNAHYSTISGGATNSIGTKAAYAFIGGGADNFANGTAATISGGTSNISSESYATVGGGYYNLASGDYSTVSGGRENSSSANYATVGGGIRNDASDFYSTIGGGSGNVVSGDYTTVGGGYSNAASDEYATIGGGYNNAASRPFATVPGGMDNTAQGRYSFAAGQRAKANRDGSFVWADLQIADFQSTANDQVSLRCRGGVRFTSGSGGGNQTVSWTPGNASWTFSSDRSLKDRVAPVDAQTVLAKVASLPLTEWSYIGHSQRHIGPMAQDFHAQFPLNTNDTMIDSADLQGVALAAIQGLNQKLEALRKELHRRDAENAELQKRLAQLEQLVSQHFHSKEP